MSKPITIMAEECKENLVNAINESDLPFFIIEAMLKDLLQEVHMASRKQLESDKVKYQAELNTAKEGA